MKIGIHLNCSNPNIWYVVKEEDIITTNVLENPFIGFTKMSTNSTCNEVRIFRKSDIIWYDSMEELIRNHFGDILK